MSGAAPIAAARDLLLRPQGGEQTSTCEEMTLRIPLPLPALLEGCWPQEQSGQGATPHAPRCWQRACRRATAPGIQPGARAHLLAPRPADATASSKGSKLTARHC